jgi:hypothetical protein
MFKFFKGSIINETISPVSNLLSQNVTTLFNSLKENLKNVAGKSKKKLLHNNHDSVTF